MYDQGRGVPQDYAEAIRWYRKAADQGDIPAQDILGLMYSNGQGVPQDHAEAARWYRKAADQGDADAQFNLGLKYYKGQGVPQDYVEAYMWMDLAASPRANGVEQKKYAEARDQIAKKMNSQQITEAQRRARERKLKSGAPRGGVI
jgi:TPR repeat protein